MVFVSQLITGFYIISSILCTITNLALKHSGIGRLKGIDKDIPVVSFSSKKLISMGFQYKYTLEDMFRGAIDTCREKGLLPYSTQINENGKEKESLPSTTKEHTNGQVNGSVPNSSLK